MNAIVGFSGLLEKNLQNERKAKEYLEKIQSSSNLLLMIINQILEMARIESGKVELDEDYVKIRDIYQGIYKIFQAEAEKKGIHLKMEYDVKHEHVICDETKNREIFLNLISNAVKYTASGGRVTIRITELDCDRKDYVRIRTQVIDTGIGMSEEFQQIAFEPFAQESSNARTAYKGTGLGLAITKRFIEIMGGEIEFISRQNVGTEFTIILPFKINRNVTEAKNSKYDAQMSIEGLKVLVAEDNEMNMEIVSFILDNAGARTVGVSDGREALDTYMNSDANEYDVILLDIMMPVMDGLETAEKIRKSGREDAGTVIIIAMSANAFYDDIERSIKAGMNTHIAKPIDADELVNIIARQAGR